MSGDIFTQWRGYRVKRDLHNAFGLLVIPAKTILTRMHLESIRKHGLVLMENDVEFPEAEAASDFHEPATNEAIVTKATEEMRWVFDSIRKNGEVPVSYIRQKLLPIVHAAADYPSLYGVLSGLRAKDDYTYRHNIGVGVITAMIGKWLNMDEDELELLTMCATMHDVGKIKISDELLNKRSKFAADEFEAMKLHTVYGHDIISRTPGSHPRMALVALQHHERIDGSGYPYGIRGNEIDLHSKIVAVADIFHAMLTNRIYRREVPFFLVLKQLWEDRFDKLDPDISSLFIRRIAEFSIGAKVQLNDGRIGKIVMVQPEDPIHPVVQLDNDEYIDLRYVKDVFISAPIG